MAITLRYPEVGIFETSGIGKTAIDKTIDAMRIQYNSQPLQGAMFVRKETPRGGSYTEAEYSNLLVLPQVNEDSAKLPYAVAVPGYKATVSTVTYRLAVVAERKMMEDDLQGMLRKSMSGLFGMGRLAIEYAIADKMNNLTSSSSGYAGADGSAMAADAHQPPRQQGSTWDNLETAAALSLTTFSTGRTNMRKRTDAAGFGYINPLTVARLVGAPDLEQTMRELKTAEKNPATSTNQPNVFRNDDWDWFVYDYQTDTNAWMLRANVPEEYLGMVYAESAAPNLAPLTFGDNPDLLWGQRLRMRFAILNVSGFALQYNAGA